MGAPASVPTAMMDMENCLLRLRRAASAAPGSRISSVMMSTRPELASAEANNCSARARAGARADPGAGIISGPSAGNMARMVLVSSVRGDTA